MSYWDELSQDNKVKIFVVFITAVFASVGYIVKSSYEKNNHNQAVKVKPSIKTEPSKVDNSIKVKKTNSTRTKTGWTEKARENAND